MFVRGVDQPIEYSRIDNSFYKGIVVKNDDPLHMFRVKVYIPELSNQPYQHWLEKKSQYEIKFPGDNGGGSADNVRGDAWVSDGLFWEITKYLPWAEASFPIMGEGAAGNYYAGSVDSKSANISDAQYKNEYLDDLWRTSSWGALRGPKINEGRDGSKPMDDNNRSTPPSYAYENYKTLVHDQMNSPVDNFMGVGNAYSYEYRPVTYSNRPKGVFGVPNVGTKVWVFHYNGDVNLPVYFGVRYDAREGYAINDLDIAPWGMDYPGLYENSHPRQFEPNRECG